jgi:hypothetical protein
MVRWFKKYFIPHEANDHQPYVLRVPAMVKILSVVLFLEIIFLVQILFVFPNTNYFASILPSVVVDLTNRERIENKEGSLVVSTSLEQAAKMKAEDMVMHGYFSHESPDGVSPWDWIKRTGYEFAYAGENLAINFFDSKDVVDAWMNSTGHRANILDKRYTEIGIGTAKGVYKGKEALFVVQFFATPTTQTSGEQKMVSIVRSEQTSSRQPQNIAGVAVSKKEVGEAPMYSSLFQKVLSTPRGMNTYILLVLLTIIALGFILNIFIKIKIQHPPLIVNGAMMLMVIGSLLVINQYLSLLPTQVF